MAEDKETRKYFENIIYGNDSKACEVHGPHNKAIIWKRLASKVLDYDNLLAKGDKEGASKIKSEIYQENTFWENAKNVKEEYAMIIGGGQGGGDQFSNYTKQFGDSVWDKNFMTEKGIVSYDDDGRPLLTAQGKNGTVTKRLEDVPDFWHVKSTEDNDFMEMQKDAVNQRNTMGNPLDFDPYWHVSKLLKKNDAWKTFATDDIGGRKFIDDYVVDNADAIASGEISDEMLNPDSFDPEHDNRLVHHFATVLFKSHDPNYQTEKEKAEQEAAPPTTPEVMASNQEFNLTQELIKKYGS